MDFRKHQDKIDLCGAWKFAFSDEGHVYQSVAELEDSGLSIYDASVPSNFELDLQTNGLIGDPFYGMNIAELRRYEKTHVWYWRSFTIDDEVDGVPQFTFEGLDCVGEVYVNGDELLRFDNMLVEHVVEYGDLRKHNEIVVHFAPSVKNALQDEYSPGSAAMPANVESLRLRKAPHMFGWDIMPRAISAGIWRPVVLRILPRERLDWVWLDTLHASSHGAALSLHFQAEIDTTGGELWELQIDGTCGDTAFQVRRRILFRSGAVRFDIADPKLWWPRGRGEANLYDVRVTLLKDGVSLDSLSLRHGMRTVALDRTSVTDQFGNGQFCLVVNGEKAFAHGSNWVPVDAYHSRDHQRIPAILDLAEDIGCNILRCWGGNVYEDNVFYDICDAKGIMIWQDFAMACAIYPQDDEFQRTMAKEADKVVRRLRQHPCIVLWAGDNECDQAYSWGGRQRNPNENILTRQTLPAVIRNEDPSRPYLPSSPFVDQTAYEKGDAFLPENHLWGPRDYYKSGFYMNSMAHFASEMGYHGCPSPSSIRKFISPAKVWPFDNNDEWILHSTSPVPGVNLFDYRVQLMADQVREMFGAVPDNLEEFSFASQISQAEAFKFFIELFRGTKWRRTGIIWWNLMDGWPQFSDAVVDYYFTRKLAYDYIKQAQNPVLVMLREPENWAQDIVACNDTRNAVELEWRIIDIDTGERISNGVTDALPDSVTQLGRLRFCAGDKRFYKIAWSFGNEHAVSHYLAGYPPFDLLKYAEWLKKAGLKNE